MTDGGAAAGYEHAPDPERVDVEQGFEQVYRQHALAVARSARQWSRDAHTAEDLAGEAFEHTLRAMRAGGGPQTSTRAYLLTVVRRLGHRWNALAGRERLFADLTTVGYGEPGVTGLPPAASPEEVALHRADQLLVAEAFLTLPERWQRVLWHTVVLGEPIVRVAPLLGLTPNATAVLAHRAREGLRRAYLRAHVRHAPGGREECRRYAGQLAAFTRAARGDYRTLRRHLRGCARCREIRRDLADVNAKLRAVVPAALVGWFAVARLTGVGQAGAEASAPVAVGATAGGIGVGLLPKVAVLTASCALATGLTNGPVAAPEAGRPAPPSSTVEDRPSPAPTSPVRGNPSDGADDGGAGNAKDDSDTRPGSGGATPEPSLPAGASQAPAAGDHANEPPGQGRHEGETPEETLAAEETVAAEETNAAEESESGGENGSNGTGEENGNNGTGGENGNNGTGGENGNNGTGGENGNNGTGGENGDDGTGDGGADDGA
ncbi:sigma factor [Streptomyces sp. B6B3]|uniref:sigma factor n=1 Tax=Streptomyces sp. B6B3 TaxID=3153570 RepID=UPI00325DF261